MPTSKPWRKSYIKQTKEVTAEISEHLMYAKQFLHLFWVTDHSENLIKAMELFLRKRHINYIVHSFRGSQDPWGTC